MDGKRLTGSVGCSVSKICLPPQFFLLGRLAVLFSGPLESEACWSSRSQELCEELSLIVGTQDLLLLSQEL